MVNATENAEKKIEQLKNEVEDLTGEEVSVETTPADDQENVKEKKSKKKAEKVEKDENPQIKLSQIVEELNIEGLDAKNARKILRKEVKQEGEGKVTWAWDTQEEADKIKEILVSAIEAQKVRKEEAAAERAAAKEAKESEKAETSEEPEAEEDEEEEAPKKKAAPKLTGNGHKAKLKGRK